MPGPRYTRTAPALHKAVDASRLSVTAALTFPGVDLAGDDVNPAGIDWTAHKATPWVGLEHWRWTPDRTDWVHPGPKDDHLHPVRVGTARNDRGGYGVELKAMPEGAIPFGTTQFDHRDRLSYQTFGLVNDGTLEGVSIEFRLIPGQYETLGRSPLEDRNSYRVHKCLGEGWVHCKQPVNPGALILKSLAPHVEQAIRVAQTGKVGGEAAHPLILKSFARLLPGKATSVTGGFARVEKAMPDAAPAETVPAYTDDEPEAADTGGNGITAVYDVAQQIEDLAASLDEIVEGTDSGELAKDVMKLAAVITAAAEKVKAIGDKHQGKLDAAKGGGEEPADDDTPPDMEKDDEGVLKAVKPHHYRVLKAMRVRRISKAEHAAAPTIPATPEPAPAGDEITPERLAGIKKSNPKLYRQIVRDLESLSALA